MPRDSQKFLGESLPGKSEWVIPGNAEVIVEAVHATFTDNGAAADWCPAVVYISDSDHKITTAMLPDVKVTAGGSAEASFFPGVKPGAAAAGTDTAAWFFASRVTNQNVASANLNRISWTHHVTSDPTVFTVQSHILANDQVIGNKPGVYIATGSLNWAAPQNYKHYATINTDFFGVSALGQSPVSDSATDQTEATRSRLVGDSIICITQSVPGEISLFAGNNDAVTHAVTLATFAISYFPNSTLVT